MTAIGSGAAITCEGVSKVFDIAPQGGGWRVLLRPGGAAGEKVEALSQVSLTVARGSFAGVIGRNGAGKSTLLRTLGGIYTPTAGTIRIAGDLTGLYELGMSGNRNLTGLGYAERILPVLGAPREAMPALLAYVRDFSELGDRLDDPILTYSAGMAARLFFATASASRHDVYLIDEILSVGDLHFQAKCWRRMRELLGQGASGILVTHDWSAVLKLCDTAHVLESGRLVRSGRAIEVVPAYLQGDAPPAFETAVARFTACPDSFDWQSGADAVIPLEVSLAQDEAVHLVFGIEHLAFGIGWEIALNGLDLPVADRAGDYALEVTIPRLPLAPGRYELSLALVAISPTDRLARRVLDSRGWLVGTPLAVTVQGRRSEALANLPLAWSARAA